MNTYSSESNKTGDNRGLVWVTTRGDTRIYLRKGSYDTVDSANRVQYQTGSGKPTFGGYPQFNVKTRYDLEYAKKLVDYAKRNL